MNEALHLIYDYVATGLRVSKGCYSEDGRDRQGPNGEMTSRKLPRPIFLEQLKTLMRTTTFLNKAHLKKYMRLLIVFFNVRP